MTLDIRSPSRTGIGDSPRFVRLERGDPVPHFKQQTRSNPTYAFDTAAGRFLVLCFYGTGADAIGQKTLAAISARRHLFDDQDMCLFGVTHDPDDIRLGRIADHIPGLRHFLDYDGHVGRLYGSLPLNGVGGSVPLRRFWLVVGPTLRVWQTIPITDDGSNLEALDQCLAGLPPPALHAGFPVQAPILVIPHVFEPELCRHLVSLYETHGGEESGFMRQVDGKTVAVQDHSHKRRRDYVIHDKNLIEVCQNRIRRRVVPEILKVHQFKVTRMERYIVACYAAEDEAHFRAHRDNTTTGTAHRRFAVSINLNDDFEGGRISFPEYGPQDFKPPVGGAVVFSCSLLHAVSKVTRGRRYAFLPFLYDDAAAAIREANNATLGEGIGQYRK